MTTAVRQLGPARPKELARRLRVPKRGYPEFRDLLKDMVARGDLLRIRGGRLALPDRTERRTGVLTLTRRGHGFVRVDGGGDDIFVPEKNLGTGLPGDRVAVRIVERPPGRSPVGEITDIIDAGPTTVVGTYEPAGELGFVVPFDPRFRRDLLIPQGEDGGAARGDMVVARITHRGTRRHGPVASVDDVLGPAGDPAVQALAVARGRGFDPDFPRAVRDDVETVRKRPLGERVDRTDEWVVTIDPADAKDHDDAISVRPLPGGDTEVGVHIADVAHYVDLGGPLDREARSRGTSVYLVDRVIPMLPEELSNGLCSLVADEPRPTVSVILTIDSSGRVGDTRLERTLIRNRRGLSYEEAQAILDRSESVSAEIDELVRRGAAVARALKERRLERGALDLDFPEARIVLDDQGVPVDSTERPRLESHGLIEELMLAANEAVARACIEREISAPFRVHDSPAGDDLEEALVTLRALGYRIPDQPEPRDVQAVVRRARGTPHEALVNWTVLRAMKRAAYAGSSGIHFGLSTSAYTHFTSPIRRYPDLMAHRAVLSGMLGQPGPPLPEGEELDQLCEELSRREREAEEAERESVLLSQLEIMKRHVGETFPGRIVGVTAFGAFVRLQEPFVEGLLHVSQIDGDYLDFDPARIELVGRRTGLTLALGKELEVLVSRVDAEERRIEFALPPDALPRPTGKRFRRRT